VPVPAPDQEVPAGWVVPVELVPAAGGTVAVGTVPAAGPAAGTSASSRVEGGSSVVASPTAGVVAAAEPVSPAGRPLEDASVVYRMP
jgi:hypothetical protein